MSERRAEYQDTLHHFATCLLLLLFAIPSYASISETELCCQAALRNLSSIPNLAINPDLPYVCNQAYSKGIPAAPDLKVPYKWCTEHCGGYRLFPPGDTNDWALPLMSFILAAVIFSTAIPRKRVLKMPRQRSYWYYSVLSFFITPFIITLDTVFWIFTVMVTAGPSMLSGLIELSLDYKVTRLATDPKSKNSLKTKEQVDVLTAVLAGNLLNKGNTADPQEELRNKFEPDTAREVTVNSLLSMLESQASFGGAVGAAVLLYIGQFGYSLLSLDAPTTENATARALAFGIWWMTIVHVSVISASLLASNNPSTAAAIVGKRPNWQSQKWRVTLAYDTRYEPAWMWSRGQSKIKWLYNTDAWRENLWFRELIQISDWLWAFLITVTLVLLLLPCGLAAWIEYRTPPVAVGCRCMTILLYGVSQVVLLGFSAFSHLKAFREIKQLDDRHSEQGKKAIQKDPDWSWWSRYYYRMSKSRLLADTLLFFFIGVAVSVTFIGTLMEISGIFRNCWCNANHSFSSKRPSYVSLATDTADDRQSPHSWIEAGVIALTFLGIITYSGWWCQRSIRNTFIHRAERLLPDANGILQSNPLQHGDDQQRYLDNHNSIDPHNNLTNQIGHSQPSPPVDNVKGGLPASNANNHDEREQMPPSINPLSPVSSLGMIWPSTTEHGRSEIEMNDVQHRQ